MKINKLNSGTMPPIKMLLCIQKYAGKPYKGERIATLKKHFSNDLFVFGENCKTHHEERLLNNFLITLAEKMKKIKLYELVGIIYSFLIKFNKDDISMLNQILPKALEYAKLQNDSVHISARCRDLCKIYRECDIHGNAYLAILKQRRYALENICENYDSAKQRFQTVSTEIRPKDKYIEQLISTRCEIADELALTDKHAATIHLMSAYNDLNKFSDTYKKTDKKSYIRLKICINKKLTDIALCSDMQFSSSAEQFEYVSQRLKKNVKECVPIDQSTFKKFCSNMYDNFKEKSQENLFFERFINLAKELSSLGNPYLSIAIFTVLREKNISNVKNLKKIETEALKLDDKQNNILGILYHCTFIDKLYKKDPNAIGIGYYLDSKQLEIKVLESLIENYDNFSKKLKLNSKEQYIENLIFVKANTAHLLRNKNPEYSKKAINDAKRLLKRLPSEYLEQHTELNAPINFIEHFFE